MLIATLPNLSGSVVFPNPLITAHTALANPRPADSGSADRSFCSHPFERRRDHPSARTVTLPPPLDHHPQGAD